MKVTVVRYAYHGRDGHHIQLFKDGVAVYGGHDQDNGRVDYEQLFAALGIDFAEVDLTLGDYPSEPLRSDFDPGYHGFVGEEYYEDDGVTYTGVNTR